MEADRSTKREGEKGMVILLMAIAIVGLIGAGSLAIDIGSALVTKSELQNVADAATLASTRELALVYKDLYDPNMGGSPDFDYKTHTLTSTELAQIQAKALEFAAANKAGGVSIVVGNSDVDTAKYDADTDTLTESTTGVRAITVTGRRDDTNNGQVQTLLARVLGINQIAITAESTAIISAMGTLNPGKGEFPIGLDEKWFDSHSCGTGETVQFHPTSPGSCTGWHTFTNNNASAIKIRNILDGIREGTFQSPETIANETYYEFTGGTVASAVAAAQEMWDAKKTCSGLDCHFRTTVPVYKSVDCANVQGPNLIVGFARIDITNVVTAPGNLVEGDVECGIFDQDTGTGAGGGGDFGTLVGTPGMVR